jgi:DNA-binding transcriptional MerR regulator
MNVADAAWLSGLPAKTIRYYEEIGLIAPPRDANGYRRFRENDLHKLGFLGRARGLGFSVAECRDLLALYEDRDRASADVRRIAQDHLARVECQARRTDRDARHARPSGRKLRRRRPPRLPNPRRLRGSTRYRPMLIRARNCHGLWMIRGPSRQSGWINAFCQATQ